jgi:hypothetical protein
MTQQYIIRTSFRVVKQVHDYIALKLVPLAVYERSFQSSVSARLYGTSHINNVPVKRRRAVNLSSNEKDERKDQGKLRMLAKQVVKDADEFYTAASSLRDKLIAALSPLEQLNDPFVLKQKEEGSGLDIVLNLGPVIGHYAIEFDMDELFLIFKSPISGQIAYNLTKSGEWCSNEDGHNFEGLLVRDLIRQIKGVPDL